MVLLYHFPAAVLWVFFIAGPVRAHTIGLFGRISLGNAMQLPEDQYIFMLPSTEMFTSQTHTV